LDRRVCRTYSDDAVRLVDVFAQLLALAINYGEQSAWLERVRQSLAEQNRLLTEQARSPVEATQMMEACRSPAMVHTVALAKQVSGTRTPVLITGETGTGKEVLAHAIHGWSDRAQAAFVAVNCAALPGSLIESELFGHVKGAFTGATHPRLGRFQAANGGVLFLDEIGELPPELQAKLLRALQDGCFEPVGSDRTVRVDVRVIAATNRELTEQVAAGSFREDLYYRLAVFPIRVPPLRARPEDIGVIAASYLDGLARRTGRGPWALSAADVAALTGRAWPGNVRELVNALERAAILADGDRLELAASAAEVGDTSASPSPASASSAGTSAAERDEPAPLATLADCERVHIELALSRAGGKIHGPGELLDINPSTLRSRMRKLGVRRPPR
jgi:transcriptional regulator with GAF, ATPase, and Fis domain